MIQQYCFASVAVQLSSTGISHNNLLPHIPSIHLPIVNSSLRPVIAPQSLNSSCRLLHRGSTSLSRVCMAAARTDSHSFRLPQINCFTLSLKCFSSDSDNCPDVGIGPLLHFPHPLRAGPGLLTLLFFPLVPLSYQVFCGSIFSFLLVRYSCPLSAGVLHVLLCLKVYS